MRRIKTATFKGKRYRMVFTDWIGGVTDTDEIGAKEIVLVHGDEFKHFATAMHEAMHAGGVPTKYLHKPDGDSDTDDMARFLWRLYPALHKPRRKHK